MGAGEISGQMSLIAVTEFGSREGFVPVNNQKNFSGTSKTNLFDNSKDQKIGPTVLSSKSTNLGGGNGGQNFWQSISNLYDNNRQDLADYAGAFNTIFIVLIFIVAFMLFWELTYAKVFFPDRYGRSVAVKFKDNVNEIKLINIHVT